MSYYSSIHNSCFKDRICQADRTVQFRKLATKKGIPKTGSGNSDLVDELVDEGRVRKLSALLV